MLQCSVIWVPFTCIGALQQFLWWENPKQGKLDTMYISSVFNASSLHVIMLHCTCYSVWKEWQRHFRPMLFLPWPSGQRNWIFSIITFCIEITHLPVWNHPSQNLFLGPNCTMNSSSAYRFMQNTNNAKNTSQ